MTEKILEIKLSDSNSKAITFATKLLAGTLNFYIDYEENFNELREVEKEETWFSTDVIRRLRITTHDMELSRLETRLVSERHERGMYLSDVVWGREVYSY